MRAAWPPSAISRSTGRSGIVACSSPRAPFNSVTSATINLVAGAAATIDVSAGDGQTADAGTPVAVPPRVLVADVSGNPVGGVNVTFAVASGRRKRGADRTGCNRRERLGSRDQLDPRNNPGSNTPEGRHRLV